MLTFVENEESINKFQEFLNENKTVIIPIFSNQNKIKSDISYLLAIGLDSSEIYVLNQTHFDSKQIHSLELLKLCEFGNFTFVYDLKYLCRRIQNEKFIDLETAYHWVTNQKIELKLDVLKSEYSDIVENNFDFIPIMKVLEVIESQLNHVFLKLHTLDVNENLQNYNLVLMNTVPHMESSGIYSVGKMHYSNYKFNTSTGRPSNTNGEYNFMALNKKTGVRKQFVSRYKDGSLLQFDYSSYHIYLIADLINYTFPDDVNLHEYLGQKSLNKNVLSDKELEHVKQKNFSIIYGQQNDYDHVDFFRKFNIYKRETFKNFIDAGYVETPIFKRRIYKDNFPDMEQHKLINYIIQSYETERNLYIIYKINEFLKNKKTKFILYIYDGFVFDYSPDDGTSVFKELTEIFEDGKYRIKMTLGKNYDEV